jgi:uncharacterized protein with beta-barrel porin domain
MMPRHGFAAPPPRVINISGLTPNQAAIANDLGSGKFRIPTFIPAFLPQIPVPISDIQQIFLRIANAPDATTKASYLNQLSPQPLQAMRSIAFDNMGFAMGNLDNHLASLRYGAGGFDTSGLSAGDSSMPYSLSQIKGHLLAWDPAMTGNGLVSDAIDPVLGGVGMSDAKDMKSIAPVTETDRWSAYISGGVVLADIDSDADVAHSKFTTGNVTAGADYRLSDNWAVGTLFGFGHTDARTDNAGSQIDVDSYSPGIYAAYADHGWFANGLFSYDYNQYNESRVITFLNRTTNGTPDGNQYNGNLDGGYEFRSGNLTFGSTAGLQFVHLDVNGFTESGAGAASLAVNEQQVDSLRSRLGGEVRYNWQWYGGKVTAVPHLSASWQHEFIDNSNGITSQFAGQGLGSFTVTQSSVERDSALVDTGIDVQWNHAFSTFIDYQVQAGQSDFFAESIQAGLKINF